MASSYDVLWKDEKAQRLAEALTLISNPTDMRGFLRDVMTEKEILEISARLEAAKMLQNGCKYTEIVKKTKLSSRTVARISEWLKNGTGGYRVALKTLTTHHGHLSPAHAE